MYWLVCEELTTVKHQNQENRSTNMEKMGWQHCKKETFTNKPYSKLCQNLNFHLFFKCVVEKLHHLQT